MKMTMSIHEFMEVQRGNLTYRELKADRFKKEMFDKGENVAKHIINSPSLKIGVVFLLTVSLITIKASAAPDFKPVDDVGRLFLTILRKFGYWVCLAMTFINIIKSVAEGERSLKGVTSGSLKYIIAFLMFYLLPMFFDLIAEAFGGQ